MNGSAPLPRALTGALTAALRAFPIAVVTGARQTGKSTLVRSLLNGGMHTYPGAPPSVMRSTSSSNGRGKLLPIEVKATSRPRLADVKSLRLFREEYRDRTRAGLLLHTGSEITWLAEGILAAPWWKVI